MDEWKRAQSTSKRGKPGWSEGRGIVQRSSGYCFGISPLILAAFLIWPFGGGKKVQMMAGRDSPAAQGQVIVKQGDNGNRVIDVKVASLAQPSSLTPPENVYLVWLQQPGHEPQNLGQIQLNGKEQGDLTVKTPFTRFEIFITAEQNAQTHTPEGSHVLSADVPAQ